MIVGTPSIFFLSKQFNILLNRHCQNGKHEFSSEYLNTALQNQVYVSKMLCPV